MRVSIRGNPDSLRTSVSVLMSGAIHGSVLIWVALGPAIPERAKAPTLYDLAIRPHEKRLIWYDLKEKLPAIAPSMEKKDPRPPRARRIFQQNVAAGPADDTRPPQVIWMPAPELAASKTAPLPNVLAVKPARPAGRPFTPPPQAPRQTELPALPDAPQVAATAAQKSLPFAAPVTRLAPRAFVPPTPAAPARSDRPVLPDAPEVAAAASAAGTLPFAPPDIRARRSFTPPPAPRGTANSDAIPAVPDAPALAAGGAAPATIRVPRPFAAPSTPPRPQSGAAGVAGLESAPALRTGTSAPEQASLAVVGLDPARVKDFALPAAPRQAGFSAGPELRAEGGSGGNTGIVVPGLLAQGAASEPQRPVLSAGIRPAYRQSIAEAARSPAGPPPTDAAVPPARLAPAPDPILEGRVVYVVAIQMPNVTSSSGSWLVWFAERGTVSNPAGAQATPVVAPVPVRKVDPKYVASAAAEHIEGKVRLSGVIRKDGRVDSIVLLRHLDVRLDQSAADALGRWEFRPALRAGAPIDVDAVFEIPFRLAPLPNR